MKCFFKKSAAMIKKLKCILIILPVCVLVSCALGAISPEYDFIKKEKEEIRLENLGYGKILVYNGADIFHKIDNTGRLNIWIDSAALGQIRPKEYVVINLDKGEYEFQVMHLDVVNMKSTHIVTIDKNTKVIRIEPTFVANKLRVTNELPEKFGKFEYAKNRD